MDMTGKVAVVTGAASGFGRATAMAFAARGASNVACLDIANEANDETVRLIEQAGGTAFAIHVDLRNVDQIRRAFGELLDHTGRLDAAVNMCGYTQMGATLEITEDEWDQAIDSNLKNGFFCCQEELKIMYKQESGSICNMSGEAAFYPMEYCVLQATAKGAVHHMSQTLALEGAAHNVRVNSVSAGIGAASKNDFFLGWRHPEAHARPSNYEYDTSNVVSPRRRGPEEIANTFVFLCSDLAEGISGQLVFVNGGGFYSLRIRPLASSDTK